MTNILTPEQVATILTSRRELITRSLAANPATWPSRTELTGFAFDVTRQLCDSNEALRSERDRLRQIVADYAAGKL